MKKLKLAVEDLHVESFQTERGEPPRGTVIAAGCSEDRLTLLEPEPGSANIYCITLYPCIVAYTETGACSTCYNSCPQTCAFDCRTTGCGDLY